MQIEISCRHDSIGDDMKVYAERKAEKLLKYFNLIQRIRVVLNVRGDGACCEMIAEVEHQHDFIAEVCGEQMRASIDAAVDKLERQLAEHKDRIRDRKGRGPHPHQPTIL